MSTDLADRLSKVERDTSHPNVRPRDAATLLVIDREGPQPRLLMGRRRKSHVFMPGMFVFPGGRVDPGDSRVPVAADYDPVTKAKIMAGMRGPKSEARARAYAVAAIRETYEEAGVLLGRVGAPKVAGMQWAAFRDRRILPDLSVVRLVARAITPPRRPRRFDTRFLAIPADHIADRLAEGPSNELEEVAWVSLDEARALKLPTITLTILDELSARMADDPDLDPATPVPFYRWKGKGFLRELL